MVLKELKLVNFKNYDSEGIRLSAQLNCFVGKNGMGKTNLLDAIYYLCMTKSYFSTKDQQVCHHDASFFRLEGQFINGHKTDKVVAKVQPRKKKELEFNNVPYKRLVEHIGLIPVVMFVPDDTQLISEGSEVRRKFLDNTLSQLDREYLNALMLYNKVLKQRNVALKRFAMNDVFQKDLITAYNVQLREPAKIIFQKRKDFLEKFTTVFCKFYQLISGEAESATCDYRSQLSANSMQELLKQYEEKDRILQRTNAGIHKDDLIFKIDNRLVRHFASQGQIKSFVLALKLAKFDILNKEKEVTPILLLDDIFDKLDKHRVKHLIQLILEGDFGQVCITDTHENRLEEIIHNFKSDYQKFHVEEGKVFERKEMRKYAIIL